MAEALPRARLKRVAEALPRARPTGRFTHILKNGAFPRSNADESEDLRSDSSSVSSQGSAVSVAEVSQTVLPGWKSG